MQICISHFCVRKNFSIIKANRVNLQLLSSPQISSILYQDHKCGLLKNAFIKSDLLFNPQNFTVVSLLWGAPGSACSCLFILRLLLSVQGNNVHLQQTISLHRLSLGLGTGNSSIQVLLVMLSQEGWSSFLIFLFESF